MSSIRIIAVDLQKDFTAEGGIWYQPRPCVQFIKDTFVPFLAEKNIKIAEIITDYRLPHTRDDINGCVPGTQGFISEIPDDLRTCVWIKSMNSPVWIRENIGAPDKEPGMPYQDPEAFTEWLHSTIGAPGETEVVLIGLALDCCILCTAQELSWRGYKVTVLSEAVDTESGNQEEKERLLNGPPLSNWAKSIHWKELEKMLEA